MPKKKTVVEKPVCGKCGADVRENTAFCYNCGSSITPEPEIEHAEAIAPEPEPEAEPEPEIDERGRSALDDLAERLKQEEADSEKLAKAAAERKRARIRQRQPKEVIWEPDAGPAGLSLIVTAVVLALLAVLVVFFTIYWR